MQVDVPAQVQSPEVNLREEHARALGLLEAGCDAEAGEILRAAVRAVLDPEVVNDLAVLAHQAGEGESAGDLLRALVWLYPEDPAATTNLTALGASTTPAPVATPPSERKAGDPERRARFLQVITDARAQVLPDNVDFLFEPWGRELPAASALGERVAEQLDLLEQMDVLWGSLGDEASRALLLRFLAFKALGPAHVRLQLDPREYRRTVIGLSATALRGADAAGMNGLPLEWRMHHYDLATLGLPIQVLGPPLPLASTMAFSQYAYRDAFAGAAPRRGDVAVDAGGCWGDTALWLAHIVGDEGHVHTFEPTPQNRRLLEHNLQLNPVLERRVTVWDAPLAGEPGLEVWLPDVVAAGATMQQDPVRDDGRRMVRAFTQSIDAMVADRRLPRVDFLKVDVEGADLGVLEGAAETIRRFRPRLALACYHKPDDLVRLPEFVAGLGVNYRWYLQCSTMTDVDTVAFGVAEVD